MAKKNTKSRYWVDDNSILPEIVITPQGNYPVLDEAGNPARTVGAIQDINPNAHIYERVNTQPFMDDYIEGETNTAANQRADALDAQVVPHIGDFVSAAAKPLDALMPSRWVGLFNSDYNGLSAVDRFSRLFDENNKGLFINDNPYGLFSKRYAEEHPYWAMAGNTAFDVASTPFIWNGANKVYNTGKTAYNTGRNAVRNYNFAKALDADIANTNLAIGEPAGARVITYGRQAAQPTTISWDEAVSLPTKITEENAAAMTPEQWDAAQRAAWEAGDLAERQRLRNLHFKVRQTGDMIDADKNPIHVYHGSPEENITELYKPNDPRLPASKGRNVKATGEEGIYTSPKKSYAARYVEDLGGRYRVPLTKEQRELLKAGKTREEIGLPPIPKGRIYDLYSNTKLVPEDLDIDFNPLSLNTEEANFIKSKGYSGFNTSSKKYPEHIVLEPNQLKLADADTFDDAGNLIPLSQRDNFGVNDIRYGFIPWLLGVGTAARAAYNASQQDNNVKAYGGLLDMTNKAVTQGGSLKSSSWNDLSMKEKADIIKVGVKHGLNRLADIKSRYNEFAFGGDLEEGNLYGKGGKKNRGNQAITISPNVYKAMKFFMDKGMSRVGAAGLVGGFMRESSGNLSPNALNPSSKALGIAQWLGSRKKELIRRYGSNPTFEQQLEFVWHELNTNYKRALRELMAAKTPTQAADAALGWYEFSVGPMGAVKAFNDTGQDGWGALHKGRRFTHAILGAPYQMPQNNGVQEIQQPMYPQQQYNQPVMMPQNPYPMHMPTVDYQKLAMQQMEMMQRDQEERERQALYLAEKEQREAERNRRMGMLNLVMSMGAPEENNDNFFNNMLGLAMSNNARKEETDYSSFNPFSLTV